jgi:hypothetical protein
MSKKNEPMNLGLQQHILCIMLICRNLFWIEFSKEDLDEKLHLPEQFLTITNYKKYLI